MKFLSLIAVLSMLAFTGCNTGGPNNPVASAPIEVQPLENNDRPSPDKSSESPDRKNNDEQDESKRKDKDETESDKSTKQDQPESKSNSDKTELKSNIDKKSSDSQPEKQDQPESKSNSDKTELKSNIDKKSFDSQPEKQDQSESKSNSDKAELKSNIDKKSSDSQPEKQDQPESKSNGDKIELKSNSDRKSSHSQPEKQDQPESKSNSDKTELKSNSDKKSSHSQPEKSQEKSSSSKERDKKPNSEPKEPSVTPLAEPKTETNPEKSKDLVQPPKAKAEPTTFDTEHLKAEKTDEKWTYEIKQESKVGIVVFNDGSEKPKEIENISYKEMDSLAYIILPKDHWFIKENPFSKLADKINLRRLAMWGRELIIVKRDRNNVLLQISAQALTRPLRLQVFDPNILFKGRNDVIGSGTQGSVKLFTYEGQEYVLKNNADEYYNMEQLFFTKGVLEIYGYFKHPYMSETFLIMPKASKSLNKVLGDKKEGINLKPEHVENMTKTLDACGQMNISCSDIKPDNVVVTSDDVPKFIDVTHGRTQGYHGSDKFKLLQTLLEAIRHESLSNGEQKLTKYYDVVERCAKESIASDAYLRYFLRYKCIENGLPDCDSVKNILQLYNKVNKDKLYEYALKVNASRNNESGTKDEAENKNGLYGTMIELPYLNKSDEEKDYAKFFNAKENMVKKFCEYINNDGKQHSFFYGLKNIYSDRCKEDTNNSGSPKLLSEFKNIDDNFKKFVMHAFVSLALYNTFQALALENDKDKLFKFILDDTAKTHNLSAELKNALQLLMTN